MAKRMKGLKNFVGAACLGEGASSTGACHEALNQAAVEKLPLVLLLADNGYAYSTPNSKQFACATLSDRAVGYGVKGHSVDGTDLEACMLTFNNAVARARQGEGPQLVVATFLRLCGHGEHDDASYVDPRLKASPLGQDCLLLAETKIREEGWLSARDLQALKLEAIDTVEDAVIQVQKEPPPDPFQENWQVLSSKYLAEGQEIAD
jgi:pyruvate dehydrogenase E1 component alpha subunit/2-oxoisovalerate dehydrogenase E1 component alpha subunit